MSETQRLDELLKDSPHFTKVSREMFAAARAELAALRRRIDALTLALQVAASADSVKAIRSAALEEAEKLVLERTEKLKQARNSVTSEVDKNEIDAVVENLEAVADAVYELRMKQ